MREVNIEVYGVEERAHIGVDFVDRWVSAQIIVVVEGLINVVWILKVEFVRRVRSLPQNAVELRAVF